MASYAISAGWRVRVRCPGCGNIVDVVMQGYTVIHHCDPTKYRRAEITEILPPDPKAGDWWMSASRLRMEILQKKSGWRG